MTQGIMGSCGWRVPGSGPVRASVSRGALYAATLMVYVVGWGGHVSQYVIIMGGPETLKGMRKPPQLKSLCRVRDGDWALGGVPVVMQFGQILEPFVVVSPSRVS